VLDAVSQFCQKSMQYFSHLNLFAAVNIVTLLKYLKNIYHLINEHFGEVIYVLLLATTV
jgi:hypothetical protein